jgi:hypothetical protein
MTAPQLAIVVDTEEEFDWSAPFSRDSRATESIPAQALAHRIYDRFGVVPTYVVNHPVATDPRAQDFLGRLRDDGKAEIGAHLHPWVTPPHEEEVSVRNSYHCNLPPALERAKIAALTAAVEQGFGARPTVFKAGRYGFGPNTARVLAEFGYRVDSSVVPHVSFEGDGGPNYYGAPDQPFWLDAPGGLLEVPATSGFIGHAAALGPNVERLFDSPRAARMRLPGLLARSGLVARTRLTPEGVSAAEQCRLIDTLARAGRTTFVMAYHSPSLAPGHTPYVRSQEDLDAFLATIDQVLGWFQSALGGRFVTLTQIDAQQRALAAAA